MRGRRSSWASTVGRKHRRLLLPRHVFGRTGGAVGHGRRHGCSRFPDGRPRRWASRTTTRGRLRSVSALTPRAILEPIGGQGPQHLVTEFASAIAAGSCGVVMLFGFENTSSLRFFEGRADKP